MGLRLCFPEEETLPVDAPAIFPIYIVQFNAYGDTKTFVQKPIYCRLPRASILSHQLFVIYYVIHYVIVIIHFSCQ